jgi:pilus assembly protein CpaF
VRDAVVREVGPRLTEGSVDDDRIRALIDKHLDRALRTARTTISPAERTAFVEATLADMVGWGVLTALMNDPTVTEVMCNGPQCVYVERSGRIEQTDVRFPSEAALRQVIDRMLAVAGRRVDEASPMADGRLADGSRINAVIPPLSLVGPVLTVRRFPERTMTIADLIASETLTTDAAVFLEAAVRGKLNIVVSGGTSTGKTTVLNVLSSFIPADERIVSIEDAAELRLAQPHVVSLESRPSNIEGAGLVTIRDLVRNALRMRPDRIVVGEVRGAEALDMLQAMNTGHEGSLTTVHANTPRDVLLRLETMVLMSGFDLPLRAIREQIASAVDLIVQVERRRDGSRQVTSIAEVQGREGDAITLQDVFLRGPDNVLRATGLRPRCADRLADRDVVVPGHVFRTSAGMRVGRAR